MRALLFGSSARRGATGWTDAARVSSLLVTALPDVVIEGESPAGGADALAREVAESLGIAVAPYPVDTAVDGPWPAAGMRRNERMHRAGRPDVAAGFISGKVGAPMSSGSAAMARICLAAGTPLVIFREDGVELPRVTDPQCRGDLMAGDLYHARRLLVGLHRAAPWARDDIERAGAVVRAALDRARSRAPTGELAGPVAAAWDAVDALRMAQPRLVPWVQVAEALVRRNAAR